MKRDTRFPSRSFPSQGRRRRRAATGALLFIAIVLAVGADLRGQTLTQRWLPESLPPVVPLYNVGAEEFPVGAWVHTYSANDRVAEHWPFARSMGFDFVNPWLFWRGGNDEALNWNWMLQLDTLFESTYAVDSGMRWWGGPNPIGGVGGKDLSSGGQAVEFYPFDSTQTGAVAPGTLLHYWLFAGADAGKGTSSFNSFYNRDDRRPLWPWNAYGPQERIYDDPGDAGLVTEHIAYVDANAYYNPYTTSRSSQNAGEFLNVFAGEGHNTFYTVLTGHLGPDLDTAVAFSDTIFIVKLYHDIPAGKKYLNGDAFFVVDIDTTYDAFWQTYSYDTAYTEYCSNCISTAGADTLIVIDSFAVTKAQLTVGAANLAEYRERAWRSDVRFRFLNLDVDALHEGDTLRPGPANHGMIDLLNGDGSTRIDVKVFWTGKERAALRSIALRNPKAELMMGKEQKSIDFRKEVLDTARRVLHGLDANGDIDLDAPVRKGFSPSTPGTNSTPSAPPRGPRSIVT